MSFGGRGYNQRGQTRQHQRRGGGRRHHHHGDGHSHGQHQGEMQQQQTYRQEWGQVRDQTQLTVETQMLKEQTQKLIESFWNLARELMERNDPQRQIFLNKKAVALCNAFGLSCEGFYEDEVPNREAITISAGLIREFDEAINKNEDLSSIRGYLNPLSNFAKCAIKGEETPNLKILIGGQRAEWNDETANNTMGKFQQGRHAIEEMESRVRKDVGQYQAEHRQQFESYGGESPQFDTEPINQDAMNSAASQASQAKGDNPVAPRYYSSLTAEERHAEAVTNPASNANYYQRNGQPDIGGDSGEDDPMTGNRSSSGARGRY